MNEEDDVQFLAAATARKRHHSEMSGSQCRSHPSWDSRGEGPSSRAPPTPSQPFASPRRTLPPPLPHMRYPGDGFDFRRPIMSTPTEPENVIDLTNESSPPSSSQTQTDPPANTHHAGRHRPPRFGRDIMTDVVDLRGEPDTDGGQPSSPEVQFLRSREHRNPEHGIASQAAETLVRGTGVLAEMIMRLREGGISPSNVVGEEALRREVARRTRNVLAPIRGYHQETHWIGAHPRQGVDLTVDNDNGEVLGMPLELDYRTAGFAIVDPPGMQPQPSYKPPSPAPEGFTRTVKEDDTLVCPNCQDELGVGENPVKQQIWVAKPCGHVYCGECCKNRAVTRGRKSAQSNAPGAKRFARCVVPECGKQVSAPKSMFQIYL